MDALDMRLSELCRRLKLPTVCKEARIRADEAARQGVQPFEYLVELLQAELDVRDERRAQRRVKEACFPLVKSLEGFDFRRSPDLPEALIRQLAGGGYIDAAEPVVLYGDPGTGKTHLATALGVAAAHQGRSVRFTTAAALATELTEAKDARELARVVGRYSRVELLIIDELGYLPLSVSDAELLFRVLGERQERRPILVTTNLPFSEWTSMFPDPRLCRAVVDRLTHRAHIIDTGLNSIRLSETLARVGRKGPTPATPPGAT
jgi:DNA replication protein DnaC